MLGSILKDDDDLRIREMTKASQEELEDYFENEGDSYRYQRMLDVSNSHSYLNSVVRALLKLKSVKSRISTTLKSMSP